MKKLVLLVSIASVLTFSSCKEDRGTVTFDLTYATNVTVPGGVTTSSVAEARSAEITTNIKDQLFAHGSTRDRLEDVYVKDFVVAVVSPTGETLDIMSEISGFIKATDAPRLEVASSGSIASGTGTELTLASIDDDIEDYFKKETFQIALEVMPEATLTEDVTLSITMTVEIRAEEF